MNNYYTSPADIAAATKARSVDINTLDASVDAAFDKLPSELALKSGAVNYAVDTGNIANIYVATLPAAVTALADGLEVVLRPTRSNTGPATLNVNGLGNIPIKRFDGNDLKANDILVPVPATLRYVASANAFYINKGDAITAGEAEQLAFKAALPQQAGNAGNFVTTDGVNARWAPIPPPVGSVLYLNSNLGGF